MARKKKKIGTCPYCFKENQILLTREHVIPSSWFAHDAFPYTNPVIIYVCQSCNNAKAVQDEWMRMWLTTLAFEKSPAAQHILMEKVKRSVESGRYRLEFQDHHKKMELTDQLPSGIYLPEPMTKIAIPDQDWKRIMAYVDQVAKGLFFHKTGLPFPATHDLQTFFALDEMLNIKPTFRPIFTSFPRADWCLDNAAVFFYGLSKAEDAEAWLCVTVFYNTIPFLMFIGPREWIEENRRLYGTAGA